MQRRTFVAGMAAVVLTPLAAQAQQIRKAHRIGVFHVGLDHIPPSLQGFREGLKALGYDSGPLPAPQVSRVLEGTTLRLDWRNLPDEPAAHETAREFVRERVDLIVAFENQAIRAAKAATAHIPVVMMHATEPVADGFVKSVFRPGGNLTGFAGGFFSDSPEKLLELFKELVPRSRRILLLLDPDDPVSKRQINDFRTAAASLKLTLIQREVQHQNEVEHVFKILQPGSVDGVFVLSPTLLVKYTALLIRLALEKHLPMPTRHKEWVEKGGLFSYAPDPAPIGRAAAGYVDRILRGTKPAELPVQFPTEWRLAINLKTARALNLTIPPSLLVRADQVIE